MASTVFHAFNMRYSKIGELAPTLKHLGISHVQFPPVQTARELSEYDGELLRQQIKLRDAHMGQFYELCAKARRKAATHPGHTFDHILKHRVYYINQPLLRAMYGYLLEGVSMDELTKHTYDRLHMIDSPVVRALLDIETDGGKKHPWHDLVVAADLVLSGAQPIHDLPDIEPEMTELKLKYKAVQSQIGPFKKEQMEVPNTLLSECSTLRKQIGKLTKLQQDMEASCMLGKLVEKTKLIRNSISGFRQYVKPLTDSVYKESVALTIINRICLYELMMFPPWWLIYQPMRLEIGNTFLGTTEEIQSAINACKANGLRVIVDIVVNNLAATGGERADWLPIARLAPDGALTLADIPDAAGSPVVDRLRKLLRGAFGTDDLGLVTVPHACEQGREPTQCWMSQALPQLNQAHPVVLRAQNTFLASLADAGVDGVRIDAAAHLTPSDCQRIISTFDRYKGLPDISYIEYLGGSEVWRAFPFSDYDRVARLEDFEIGEYLYKTVFGPQADLERTKNYGGMRLRRYPNLDSVVMLVNHDHVMGSIPSALYSDLPSQITYELSLAYLTQRVYGHVLIMPHDLSSEYVLRAVAMRVAMRDAKIVREYVTTERNAVMMSYKFDADGNAHFISLLNLNNVEFPTIHGIVAPLSFQWFALNSPLDESELCKVYNSQHNTWMPRCYIGARSRGKTLRATTSAKKRDFTRRKAR